MNVTLAISIILALGCCTIVRGLCFYNLRKGTNHGDKLTSWLIGIMFLSTLVFALGFMNIIPCIIIK